METRSEPLSAWTREIRSSASVSRVLVARVSDPASWMSGSVMRLRYPALCGQCTSPVRLRPAHAEPRLTRSPGSRGAVHVPPALDLDAGQRRERVAGHRLVVGLRERLRTARHPG